MSMGCNRRTAAFVGGAAASAIIIGGVAAGISAGIDACKPGDAALAAAVDAGCSTQFIATSRGLSCIPDLSNCTTLQQNTADAASAAATNQVHQTLGMAAGIGAAVGSFVFSLGWMLCSRRKSSDAGATASSAGEGEASYHALEMR